MSLFSTRLKRTLLVQGVFVGGMLAGTVFLYPILRLAFLSNPFLNGVIVGVFLIGLGQAFRTVFSLSPDVHWLQQCRRGEGDALPSAQPRLMKTTARLLAERLRKTGGFSLSPMTARSLLEGLSSRLTEHRETSRYLVGLLVFLGLLGTFWGLLKTVQSLGSTISALNFDADHLNTLLMHLQEGLQAPLQGMGTAFSSSLFGLAGSLVLGFLALQSAQFQEHFYKNVEEWLSEISHAGFAPDAAGYSVPLYVQALLERVADHVDALQRSVLKSGTHKDDLQTAVLSLTDKLVSIVDSLKVGQDLMLKVAEGQLELSGTVKRVVQTAEQREHMGENIRHIYVLVEQLLKETIQGRERSTDELRSELRLIARTLAVQKPEL